MPMRPRRAPPPIRRWTLARATGTGLALGAAALLLAIIGTPNAAMLYLYAALLAATALCGASMLWITAFDMRDRGTSGRMRPIRTFDMAIGLFLLALSLWALSRAWPLLELAS
jgi:heme/copper-type cytochrome/quinol oxidase subunit 1